jgi:ATP-dependent Zn protease
LKSYIARLFPPIFTLKGAIVNFIFWSFLTIVFIALVTAFLEKPTSQREAWSYNHFIQEVKSERVEKVKVADNWSKALVTTNDGKIILVEIPIDPSLNKILTENQVKIVLLQDRPVLISLAVNLFLLVALIYSIVAFINSAWRWLFIGMIVFLLMMIFITVITVIPIVSQREKWSYSYFLEEIENARVEKVEIAADRSKAWVNNKDGSKILVDLPNTHSLSKILVKNNVKIYILPRSDNSPLFRALTSLFLPILLLIVPIGVGVSVYRWWWER